MVVYITLALKGKTQQPEYKSKYKIANQKTKQQIRQQNGKLQSGPEVQNTTANQKTLHEITKHNHW